jgi:hypothetical protein
MRHARGQALPVPRARSRTPHTTRGGSRRTRGGSRRTRGGSRRTRGLAAHARAQAIAHEAGVPGTDVALDLTGPTHQLHQPADMIVARSTAFGTKAWEQLGRGSIYTRRLADEIRARAAACSVEDLLKLTQGAIHNEPTPRQQVAHVDSSLGAYHLHLGPEIPG